jgi:hypothetical protein
MDCNIHINIKKYIKKSFGKQGTHRLGTGQLLIASITVLVLVLV